MLSRWKTPSTTMMFTSFVGISVSVASYIFLKIHYNLISCKPAPKTITSKKLSPDEVYIEEQRKAFIDTFTGDLHADKMNENIESAFYNKDLYKEAIADNDNTLERAWKSRILHESTSRGTVTMRYDAYKQAFAYYADVSIPYSILNAVAMKYTTIFLCRDFFLDEAEIPTGNTTPFLCIHNIDKSTEKKGVKIDVKKGPFAKLKKYNVDKPNERKTTSDTAPKNFIKNKFISLGKQYNFSILNNTDVVKTKTVSNKPILKYGDFKSWRNPEALELQSGDSVANQFTALSND